ncbi:MAG: hypothetical protein AAGA18_15320 [Verrucomicrobiota bacterium]
MNRYLAATVAVLTTMPVAVANAQVLPDFDSYKLSTDYCDPVVGGYSETITDNGTANDSGSNSTGEQSADSSSRIRDSSGNGKIGFGPISLGGGGGLRREDHHQSSANSQTHETYDRDQTNATTYQLTLDQLLSNDGNCTAVTEGNTMMAIQNMVSNESIINTQTSENGLTERAEIDANARIQINQDQQATYVQAIESQERLGMEQIQMQRDSFLLSNLLDFSRFGLTPQQ